MNQCFIMPGITGNETHDKELIIHFTKVYDLKTIVPFLGGSIEEMREKISHNMNSTMEDDIMFLYHLLNDVYSAHQIIMREILDRVSHVGEDYEVLYSSYKEVEGSGSGMVVQLIVFSNGDYAVTYGWEFEYSDLPNYEYSHYVEYSRDFNNALSTFHFYEMLNDAM